jgi:hypothetical protein
MALESLVVNLSDAESSACDSGLDIDENRPLNMLFSSDPGEILSLPCIPWYPSGIQNAAQQLHPRHQ